MAIKKTEATAEQPQAVPEAPAFESAPAPAPVTTPGHHQLSEDEARRVSMIKEQFASAIKYLRVLRDSVHDAEVQHMYSVAITEAETASMWAVRATTYRG